MIWMFEERRVRRSESRATALRYQLEHTRESGGIEALVLADDDGLPLAQSGDPAVCAELGAIAPLLGRTVLGMPLPPLLRGGEVIIRPVHLYGQRLYLACIGGNAARDAFLKSSLDGVHRILASN